MRPPQGHRGSHRGTVHRQSPEPSFEADVNARASAGRIRAPSQEGKYGKSATHTMKYK